MEGVNAKIFCNAVSSNQHYIENDIDDISLFIEWGMAFKI
jgi:hypothetical protein